MGITSAAGVSRTCRALICFTDGPKGQLRVLATAAILDEHKDVLKRLVVGSNLISRFNASQGNWGFPVLLENVEKELDGFMPSLVRMVQNLSPAIQHVGGAHGS